MFTNCSSDKEDTQKRDKEEDVFTEREKEIYNETGCHVKDATLITDFKLLISANEERYLYGAKQNKFWFSKYTKEGNLLWEVINPTPNPNEKHNEYLSKAFNPVILSNGNIAIGCTYLDENFQVIEILPILTSSNGEYKYVYNKERYIYSNIDTFEDFFICTISDKDMNAIPTARRWYIQISNDGNLISEGSLINPLYKIGTWISDSEFIASEDQLITKVDTKKGESPLWTYPVSLGEYKSYKATTTFIENNSVTVAYEIERNNGTYESKFYKLFINNGAEYVSLTKILLDATFFKIGINNEHKFEITTTPENIDLSTLIWESSNKNIAIVDNGILKGISEGNCIITVSNYEKTVFAECKVKVSDKSIIIENDNIKLLPSYEFELKYTVKPEGMQLKWKSSNENVATVNNGKIHAKSKGTATITATSIEDEEIQGICNISVVDISSMMDLEFSSGVIIINGGYVTGSVYSSITNNSNENITLTRFEVTDSENNTIVLSSEDPAYLGSLKFGESKSFGALLNHVYKPKFTWYFKYNGEDYKTSHIYQYGDITTSK